MPTSHAEERRDSSARQIVGTAATSPRLLPDDAASSSLLTCMQKQVRAIVANCLRLGKYPVLVTEIKNELQQIHHE